MVGKRLSQKVFDDKKAFEQALSYELSTPAFVNEDFRRYFEAVAQQCGVTAEMLIGPFLVATSNLMDKSRLRISESWTINQNLYILTVAPKGSGKSHSTGAILNPFIQLEKEEKEQYDNERRTSRSEENETGNGSGDCDLDEEENEMGFHRRTRMVDLITPEALILTLYHGSGTLVIKADEFLTFYNKCIKRTDNKGAICMAFTGEAIMCSTVGRGEKTVHDSRLCLHGSIQSGPACELLNEDEDHQGYWDRHILITATEDPSVGFFDKLKSIPEEVKVDLLAYYRALRDNHLGGKEYKADKSALEEMNEVTKYLRQLDVSSDFSFSGLNKKAFTNLQKLAIVYAGARETLESMKAKKRMERENDQPKRRRRATSGSSSCARQSRRKLKSTDEQVDDLVSGLTATDALPDMNEMTVPSYIVIGEDVRAAFDVVKHSLNSFKCYKNSVMEGSSGNAEEQDQDIEVTDELLLSPVGRNKIRKIFRTADANGHILVSIIKRCRFFPPKVSADQFVKALVEYKLAVLETKKSGNNMTAPVLKVVCETDDVDQDTMRLFRLLYNGSLEDGVTFDPLGVFDNPLSNN